MALVGGPKPAFSHFDHPDVRQILMIAVNADAKSKPSWSLDAVAPSLSEVVGSVTSDQIDRYSFETIELVSGAYERWAEELSTPERPVTFHFVEVAFDAVQDDEKRAYLNDIGTKFDLEDEQVDALIAAARKVIRESPEFQEFLAQNRGKSPATD